MKWITREKPEIDRLACPWLIKKFVDPEAEFIYAPAAQVLKISLKLNAIPFDIPDVEYTHYQGNCTFDYIIKKHNISDPAISVIADIVRAADTDQPFLSPEAPGLRAISSGLGLLYTNDYELLAFAMKMYDGLYLWAKHLKNTKHVQMNSQENRLHEVYTKYLSEKSEYTKKAPDWVKQLKDIIQDQIDSQFYFDLKKISDELDLHPSYLSRAFSKYFDNMSFGEYIRKLRIEKAISLIEESQYSLAEIAYLTGFSDQSHFSRIFRQVTGFNPSRFRKKLFKGKQNTKS